MPYVFVSPATRAEQSVEAEARWSAITAERPELDSAVALQRTLVDRVMALQEKLEQRRLPRLSLPAGYLAAKLGRGVPVLAGEPIPLPLADLTETLLGLCSDLSAGGAGE